MIVQEPAGYFVTLRHHDRDFVWGSYPTEADARAVEARVRKAFAQEDAAATPPPDLSRARSPDSWRQPALFEQGGPA